MPKPARTDGEIASTIQNISSYFNYLSRIGAKGFDCSPQSLEMIKAWGDGKKRKTGTTGGPGPYPALCHQCRLRGKSLPSAGGEGDPNARLMFVGGAPTPDMPRGDAHAEGEAEVGTGRDTSRSVAARGATYRPPDFDFPCEEPASHR